MNPGIGHQVGLELVQINIESPVKPKRSCDRRYDLSSQPVEIDIGGTVNLEVVPAQIIDGLVVHQEGDVAVVKGGVRVQEGVVGLYHRRGDLGSRVD